MVRQISPYMATLLVTLLINLPFLFHSDFCYVNRSCNKVADALAKRASVGLDFQVWLEDCPGDIAPLVLYDVP